MSDLESHRGDSVTVRRPNHLGVYSSIGQKMIGHYQVHEQIGSGGIGLIYKARDLQLGRWVALKSLQPWAIGKRTFREQLIKEGQAAARLNHPNIITVHEVVPDADGTPYIVMEFLSGQPLVTRIPKRGFSVPKTLYLARQIAEALAAAENAGIVHGDLKPENIMVSGEGRIKVLDFGLARGVTSQLGATENSIASRFGTVAYMAPERLRMRRMRPTTQSDVFSFGLIFRQMLLGHNRTGHGSIELPERVPAALKAVVYRCLEKTPKRRFASMRELLSAIKTSDKTSRRSNLSMTVRSVTAAVRSHQTSEIDVRRVLNRLGYHNVADSRLALSALQALLQRSPAAAARRLIRNGIRQFVLRTIDFGDRELPMSVRELRQQAFSVLSEATAGKLTSCFRNGELEHFDLYGVNFSGANLSGISFRGCFLAGSDFSRCDLSRTVFVRAAIRNANFEGATVSDANFTDADWFNALGLTSAQLGSIQTGTLLPCPGNVAAMHRYLRARYVLPFASWPKRYQEELERVWTTYMGNSATEKDFFPTVRKK